MSQTPVSLRLAGPPDATAIAALHAESWRSAYRDALAEEYLAGPVVADREAVWSRRLLAPSDDQYVVAAESEGALAGFACALAREHPVWGSILDNLHVSPAARGRGWGRACS